MARPEPTPAPPGAGRSDDAQRMAKQGTEDIGRQARELKDHAREAAGEAKEKAKDAATHAAGQARVQAGRIVAQLKEQGASVIDQQKSRAAGLIGDCVAATRRASQKLHDENDHNLADYADMLADRLDSARDYLREQDASRIVNDAADVARRKPEWVLGGAFVLGLVAARFLKSSRPDGAAYGSYRYDDDRYGDRYGDLQGGDFGSTGYASRDPRYYTAAEHVDPSAGPTGSNEVALVTPAPGAAAPASGAPTATNTQAQRPEVM